MWSPSRRLARRKLQDAASQLLRLRRSYNGSSNTGPHTTYFQPPQQPATPPSRSLRNTLLISTGLAAGFYAHSWLYNLPLLGISISEEDIPNNLEEALSDAAGNALAKSVPALKTVELATEVLESRAGYSVTPTAVSHTCQSQSNAICEDTWSSGTYTYYNDPAKDWSEWAIFDGHAGPRTANVLKELLPAVVGDKLWESGSMKRTYSPNDTHIIRIIKQAFTYIDDQIFSEATQHLRDGDMSKANTVSLISNVLSGSCALLAVFDPARSVLRVANTGDSRAVLGRWDNAAGKYVAEAMSVDQTGFNQDEVERLRREHPDEDPIDPKSGRLFGLAVARAFGDARWKWPEELTRLSHEKYWGHAPRPNGVIKSPPYLTAEPEVMETKIQSGAHPDFLIMASDGLWDQMSNQDAVTCVQMWLDKFTPTNFLNKKDEAFGAKEMAMSNTKMMEDMLGPAVPKDDDDDTYYDEAEGCLKWRCDPKHFVVEDSHCGVHLIKNALGGSRRDLFTGVMSVQPPLSRNVRDDITVQVIFFGVDASKASSEMQDVKTLGRKL